MVGRFERSHGVDAPALAVDERVALPDEFGVEVVHGAGTEKTLLQCPCATRKRVGGWGGAGPVMCEVVVGGARDLSYVYVAVFGDGMGS